VSEPSALPAFSPTSLDELFSRDPLQLADQDLDIIVEELRRQRAAWETGQKAKPRETKQTGKNLSLDDLIL
jgi:hypothetical protein